MKVQDGLLQLKHLKTSDFNIKESSKTVEINWEGLITAGSLDGSTLKLKRASGDIEIDLSSFSTNDKFIESGSLKGKFLELVYNDASKVSINLDGLVDTRTIIQSVQQEGFKVKKITGDYTIEETDYVGSTILMVEGNHTLTVPTLDDSKIGYSLIIRAKLANPTDKVKVLGDTGVSLSPEDSLVLRRNGSTVVLVYTGNSNFEVFGELP